jgi:hypothetical protein
LPMWEVEIEIRLPTYRLINTFEDQPLLPGIILTDNQQFISMISRQRFFEHMSRPYSSGLFAQRPIINLYNFLQPEVFICDQKMLVVEATQAALERSLELVYEPIVVKKDSGKYGIIDFHQLLLAHSQIHTLTLAKLQTVEKQSQIAKAGFRDLNITIRDYYKVRKWQPWGS